MSRSILFRCDATPASGAGHVMRCLALAETLAETGFEPVFASAPGTTATVPDLGASGFPVIDCVDGIAMGHAGEHLATKQARAVIIDGYHFDVETERQARKFADTVVACEDLPNRPHESDVLVDPTPGRSKSEYENLVPESTRVLTGGNYAFLRRRWRETKRQRIHRSDERGPYKILISMGATDPGNATAGVLEAIATLDVEHTVEVILGTSAPHIDEVRRQAHDPRICVNVNPGDLAERVARSDLVIGAPGSSAFERAILGIPSILLTTAANQVDNARALAAAGAAQVVSSSILAMPIEFGAVIADLLRDAAARRKIGQASQQLCDGRGTHRVLCLLAGHETAKDGTQVGLRLAEQTDCDWMLALQSAPPTRRFARNATIPSAREHADWFTDVLDDPDRILFIVTILAPRPADQDPRMGFVRLDRKPHAINPTFEISIAIAPAVHGRGYANAALDLARRTAPGVAIDASVLEANRVSRALFTRAGYSQVANELYRSLPE